MFSFTTFTVVHGLLLLLCFRFGLIFDGRLEGAILGLDSVVGGNNDMSTLKDPGIWNIQDSERKRSEAKERPTGCPCGALVFDNDKTFSHTFYLTSPLTNEGKWTNHSRRKSQRDEGF